jgi:hypothetical protein
MFVVQTCSSDDLFNEVVPGLWEALRNDIVDSTPATRPSFIQVVLGEIGLFNSVQRA